MPRTNIRITSDPLLVGNLVSAFRENDIRIPNELQREYVWDVKRRHYFIDSVLCGFPFGQLVLHKRDDDVKYIIDGQQRAVTLFSYKYPDDARLDGIRTVDKNISAWARGERKYSGFCFKPWSGLTRDEKKNFDNALCSTICVEGTAGDAGQVFRRLQQGIPLRPGDILYASTTSPWHSALREITSHEVFQKMIAKDKRRAQAWMLAAQILSVQMSQNVAQSIQREVVENILDDPKYATESFADAANRIMKLLDIISEVDELTRESGDIYRNWTTNKRVLVLFNLLCRTSVNGKTSVSAIAKVYSDTFIHYLDGSDIKPEHRSYIHDQRRFTPQSENYREIFKPVREALDKVVPTRDETRNFSPKQREEIISKANWKCAKCKEPITGLWQADHIVSWFLGGMTTIENGQALCLPCHAEKTASDTKSMPTATKAVQ